MRKPTSKLYRNEPETQFRITKVKKATSKSGTLESTIPQEWAKLLELKPGDLVRWQLGHDDKNRPILILRRQD